MKSKAVVGGFGTQAQQDAAWGAAWRTVYNRQPPTLSERTNPIDKARQAKRAEAIKQKTINWHQKNGF